MKWAGGKQWLASAAPQLSPTEWSGRYFEPFLGGAAFFLSLNPETAILSDSNPELITAYTALANDEDAIVEELEWYPHEKNFYYYIRAVAPRAPHKVAARFIYLNRTCWNGLYRVNKSGKFNTPFGAIENPTIVDEDRLAEAAARFQKARLIRADFEEALELAKKGDFVYCDPPYINGHHNNGFVKYNARLFAWADQVRLARVAAGLVARGVHVLVSNAEHQSVVELYRGFLHYRVLRRSLISGQSSYRRWTPESLLSSYPILGCDTEVV